MLPTNDSNLDDGQPYQGHGMSSPQNKHTWMKEIDGQAAESANRLNLIGSDALTLPRLTFDCKPWSAVT